MHRSDDPTFNNKDVENINLDIMYNIYGKHRTRTIAEAMDFCHISCDHISMQQALKLRKLGCITGFLENFSLDQIKRNWPSHFCEACAAGRFPMPGAPRIKDNNIICE